MSVKKSDRKQNYLQVIQLSQELLIYTIRTCHNEKVFKKRYYKDTAETLIEIAKRIMQKSVLANNIDLFECYEQRLKFQQEALLESLLFTSYIITFSSGELLQKQKALKFQQFISAWRHLCKQWIKSDKQRLTQKNNIDEKVLD